MAFKFFLKYNQSKNKKHSARFDNKKPAFPQQKTCVFPKNKNQKWYKIKNLF